MTSPDIVSIHLRGTTDWYHWVRLQAYIRGYRTQYGEPCVQSVLDDALGALAQRDGLPYPPRRRWAEKAAR